MVSFLFAAVSTACCWLAIALGALGLGAGAVASTAAGLRPAALGLMFVFLAAAGWSSWRKVGRVDGVVIGLSVAALVVAFVLHGAH